MAEEYLDPQLPVYRPVDKLEGKISLIGSDTMSQVVVVWKDSFKKFYPNVEVTIAVKGATNAIPSVMKGEATIGMLSREATHEEIEAFTTEKKYAPKLLVPSLERIGVYVSECNPIESLTLAQSSRRPVSAARRRNSRLGANSASPAIWQKKRSRCVVDPTPPDRKASSSQSFCRAANSTRK
jgi:hypothetical protein